MLLLQSQLLLRMSWCRKVEWLLLWISRFRSEPLGLSYWIYFNGALLNRIGRVILVSYNWATPAWHSNVIRWKFLTSIWRIEPLAISCWLWLTITTLRSFLIQIHLNSLEIFLSQSQSITKFHVFKLEIRYFTIFLTNNSQVLLLGR